MGSLPSETKLPWTRTPCVYSRQLSRVAGCNIYLKLDYLQPSGSFKSRGIGNYMTRALARSPSPAVHFYCSSGGNAGLACATCALSLRQPATIVIPTTAKPIMRRKLLELGADVYQVGNNWTEADRYLRDHFLSRDPAGIYVPPFDHPDIWDGVASIVGELREQVDGPIDAVVCAVGGGGLCNGLMQGIESYPWSGRKPHVLAVETEGADSLHASVLAGEHIALTGISSIATSLGATKVSEQTWQWSHSPNMTSIVVSDADAAVSCVRFADDARTLVEVSCGAALAPAYRGDLRMHVGKGCTEEQWSMKNVVLEVCGGAAVTLDILDEYRELYGPLSSIKV